MLDRTKLPEAAFGGPESKGLRSEDPASEDSNPQESVSENGSVGSVPRRFRDMGLSRATLRALKKAGYEEATPIQGAFIPQALTGRDILGQARTGTGKTAAFMIPVLEDLEIGLKDPEPQVIALVPTRELAAQVYAECLKLSFGRKVRQVMLCGGKPINKQIQQLKSGVDIVVGTPGRVIDHIQRRTLDLQFIDLVVLDEADRMLDIGFRPEIEKILRKCPPERQTMLLSATVPPEVEKLARRYMVDPLVVNVSQSEVAVETIDQYYMSVPQDEKFSALLKLVTREKPQQAIIFCRTKRGTDRIAQRLAKKHDCVAAIHGDLTQRARDRVMEQFRAGKVRYLVATDVVGRGIDVSSISHIINFDIPQDCDDYVHRVGRTGRMGRAGVAYTFVTKGEGPQLTAIEARINRLLKPYQPEAQQADPPANSPPANTPAANTPAANSSAANSSSGQDSSAKHSQAKNSRSPDSRTKRRQQRRGEKDLADGRSQADGGPGNRDQSQEPVGGEVETPQAQKRPSKTKKVPVSSEKNGKPSTLIFDGLGLTGSTKPISGKPSVSTTRGGKHRRAL